MVEIRGLHIPSGHEVTQLRDVTITTLGPNDQSDHERKVGFWTSPVSKFCAAPEFIVYIVWNVNSLGNASPVCGKIQCNSVLIE